MTDEMRCVLPFPDDSPSFVHGFEAGGIWHRMEVGEYEIDGLGFPLHTANDELYRSMAAYFGYDVQAKPTDWPEWTEYTFTKRRSRLSVVE